MLFPYELINDQFKMKHQPIRNDIRHKKIGFVVSKVVCNKKI